MNINENVDKNPNLKKPKLTHSHTSPNNNLIGYILVSQIQVLNANAISSPLTYGFPALSGFLGAIHALSRKIHSIPTLENIDLNGVLIASHDCQIQAYRESPYKDYSFIQTRNPLNKSGGTAGIVEEGRCHIKVSLLIGVHLDNPFGLENEEQENILVQAIKTFLPQQRLAGGSITHFKNISFHKSDDVDSLKNKLLPAFVLMEAQDELQEITEYLQEQSPQTPITTLDSLIETATIHHIPIKNENGENWDWKTTSIKQGRGWIVPIPLGFQGISPKFSPYEMENCRNPEYPSQYVEAIYGLGKWVFPHRIANLAEALWYSGYDEEQNLYIFTQNLEYFESE